MRTGELGIQAYLEPVGPGGARIEAGRVTIAQAQDDTGAVLRQETTNTFHTVSVGRVDDSKDLTSREPTPFSLWGLAKGAKLIKSVSGTMEFIVPDLDPRATAVVDALPAKFGSPINSPELSGAGVTVTVFDGSSAVAAAGAKAPGGPQDYDAGPLFGPVHPPPGFPKYEMKEGDIAFAIDDPGDRLIALEIQARDGSPLRYNHGGNYHSSLLPGHPGRRFDTYRLGSGIPADARLVCWLVTDKALLKIPFHVEMLPIPELDQGRRELGMMSIRLSAAQDASRENRRYEKESGNATQHGPATGEEERLLGLWLDVPIYAEMLQRNDTYTRLPQLASSVAPEFPAGVMLPPGAEVKVDISFVVDAKGGVEAARVFESGDERFDVAAIETVLKWRFRPGEIDGKPAKVFVRIPFVFRAPIIRPADLLAPPAE